MTGFSVQSVSKSYSGKRVADSISFTAGAGEILGFLGPNGAGKTTTIRMIMGITAPDEGKIIFTDEGKVMERLPQSQIGYLPEERGLYKEARVMNILLFLAGLKNVAPKLAKERAMTWLQRFDLADYSKAKIEELSKGMAQKVQFIGSILHNPKYIILDEPFSGLDPVSQDVFKKELRNLANAGSTVVLSSHQMNIMEELCDRIFLIHHGRQVFFGSLSEIKEKYGNFQINISMENSADLEVFCAMPQILKSEITSDTKATIILKDEVLPAEFLSSIPAKSRILELSVARTSLHDIFVKIAKGA